MDSDIDEVLNQLERYQVSLTDSHDRLVFNHIRKTISDYVAESKIWKEQLESRTLELYQLQAKIANLQSISDRLQKIVVRLKAESEK